MPQDFIQLSWPLLKCAPGVEWRAEADGIMVVSPRLTFKLPYPEAALWDFVVRGLAQDRMAAMLQHIGGFPDSTAASAFVDRCLSEWRARKLIVAVGPESPPGPAGFPA